MEVREGGLGVMVVVVVVVVVGVADTCLPKRAGYCSDAAISFGSSWWWWWWW